MLNVLLWKILAKFGNYHFQFSQNPEKHPNSFIRGSSPKLELIEMMGN